MNPRGDCIRAVHPLFQEEGGGSIPTSPLQFHIGWIDVSRALELNWAWHSRLPSFTYPMARCRAFAAEFNDVFYAVAIWSQPSARALNYTGRYELRRFAIAPDAPKNTASRMLRVMRVLILREMPEVETLISYQDTGVHTGAIYKAAGWTPVYSVNQCTREWSNPKRPTIKAQAPIVKVRWEIARSSPTERRRQVINEKPQEQEALL